MVFDFVNLPAKTTDNNRALDQFGCSSSYVSIASLYRPNEDYRLCGQRRGVKLITTYNTVLINFVTTGLNDPTSGFSMIFRVIQQQTSNQNQAVSTQPSRQQVTTRFTPTFTTTQSSLPPILTSARINPVLSSTMRYVRSIR